MSDEHADLPEDNLEEGPIGAERVEAEVELISDGEYLLVLGDSKRDVASFLRSRGLLDRAHAFGGGRLIPALRASAEIAHKLSDTAAESGLWVKLTPESAEAIKEFGLTNSTVPGIAHAMAGARGSMKKWLQIDVKAGAKSSNPVALSGIAGALSQAAHEQEAAQLRALVAVLDRKLDEVLRGQRDDILGDLAGAEREVRAAMSIRALDGSVDALTWSKLSGASLQIRQMQSKAVLKLGGIADDLESRMTIGKLNEGLQQTEAEVSLWLSAVARSTTVLDDLAVLELTRYAELDPGKVNGKRLALAAAKNEDQAELHEGIAVLIRRMDAAAVNANQHKLLHARGVPKALHAIENAKSVIKSFYKALGIEVDWENLDPTQWLAAIREWRQWRNAATEAATLAWEKGKPVLGSVALLLVGAALRKFMPGGDSGRNPVA